MTAEKKRNILLGILFKMAAAMGTDPQEAVKDVIQRMYPNAKRSTKNLTIDELACVVREVSGLTGEEIDITWMFAKGNAAPGGKAEKGYRPGSPTRAASERQWDLIAKLAAQLGMNEVSLQDFVDRFHMNPQGELTVRGAQGAIQAMLAMLERRKQEAQQAQPEKKEPAKASRRSELSNPLDQYPEVPPLGKKYRRVKDGSSGYIESELLKNMKVNYPYEWQLWYKDFAFVSVVFSRSMH